MLFTKAVSIGVLAVATCAVATHADAQDRGRRRSGHGGRVIVQPRVIVRPPVVARRYARPPVVGIAPFGGRLAYGPVYRPSIGVGIYIGSPYRFGYPAYRPRYYATPYPYSFSYPYPYPYPYTYGYPYPGAGLYAVPPPPDALYGGVRLDVSPRDAAVYVDGYYAGIVDDFDGTWQRIALEPGPHRFEIVAQGYETLTFEINVRPYQTVRYRGDLVQVVP
jgi:hypothetical protein